ncbi:MAG: aminoacyl-tRNA hydrolase [Bacteroidales bacterium]|nr:aminoacyl-tRNA hydrolase [Bacteroidales bacterium]
MTKFLIAGLGNIGDEYENTRHNIGFMILDAFAGKEKLSFSSKRYAFVSEFKYRGKILFFIKPSTFMNLSGNAVRYWLQKENILLENLLVVCDDIALPLGSMRMKTKGGDGSHNGLTSIIETLGTSEFPRLRFGIGNDFPKGYQSDYVLGKWSKEENQIILPKIETATEMIKSFVTFGSAKTMTDFNK